MRNFKDYKIWHQGIELAVVAYRLAAHLPKDERFGLASQIKRAAVSIAANIAEGCGRDSDSEFKRFLEYSLGSAFELNTQLILTQKLQLLEGEELDQCLDSLQIQQKQINSLISRIKANKA